ncbi:MFS transporter [Vulgatibacter incomptus]|nr:MFS transporter [Vulgatibacter incomptus]
MPPPKSMPSPPEGNPSRHVAFAAVAIGTFMSTLDASVVNIALPTLARDFGADLGQVEWVVLSYLLALSALLLNAGRLVDVIGQRRVYTTGLLVFGIASGACALSGSVIPLVIARVVQGVGGAMMNAAGPAILTAAYPPAQRGRVLGLVGLAVSAGLAAGPAVGGFIIGALSWHWIFLPNVPISFVAAFVASRAVPAAALSKERFDVAGSILLGLFLTALMLLLTQVHVWGVWSAKSGALLALSLGLLIAFLIVEKRVRAPVIDLGLFRNRLFTGSAAAGFLVFVTLGAVNLVMPFYLTRALGLSTTEMGLVLTSLPVVLAVVSPFSGWLSDRLHSTRGIASTGAILAAVVLVLLRFAVHDAVADAVTVAALLGGLGLAIGTFQSPNNSAVMGSVRAERLGTAGGLLASMRVTGLLVGNAVGGAAFLAASGGSTAPAAAAKGLALSSLVGAATGLLAATASLARGPSAARPST